MSKSTLSRRHFLKLVTAATATTAGYAFPNLLTQAQQKARKWHTTGTEFNGLESFEQAVQKFMQDRNIPGGQLAVTRKGQLVLARGYSWSADPNEIVQPTSLFRIASITKPFTSAAIMILVQRGKLALNQKLVDLVNMEPPKNAKPDPRLKDITILNLLQHQGGWDRDTAFDPMFYDDRIAKALGVKLPISIENIVTFMAGQQLQHDPGSQYVYSNFGYLLLGRVIAEASGQNYEAFVEKEVLKPLDIKRMKLGFTSLEKRQPDEVAYYTMDANKYPSVVEPKLQTPIAYGSFNLENMAAHGRWLASAVDLVRFASSFDQPDQSPILNTDSIGATFAMPSIGKSSDGSWYGLGWAVRTAGKGLNTWHDGSLPGTSTLMVRRFDGLNWAVLFDQRDDPSGKDYGEIDGMLHQAADAVKRWPDVDHFSDFGIS